MHIWALHSLQVILPLCPVRFALDRLCALPLRLDPEISEPTQAAQREAPPSTQIFVMLGPESLTAWPRGEAIVNSA